MLQELNLLLLMKFCRYIEKKHLRQKFAHTTEECILTLPSVYLEHTPVLKCSTGLIALECHRLHPWASYQQPQDTAKATFICT